jgi:hypothetical protein
MAEQIANDFIFIELTALSPISAIKYYHLMIL